jgi:hypothetical protein
MKGSASRPNSATMNGTRCAIRPATKATSRESRSSFDTNTLHFALLAAASAASELRPPIEGVRALPVSASTYSAMIVKSSASANRVTAARCASMPNPKRCLLLHGTR